ncbi:Crp/Fnr family transcriptional regulator [Rhizobium grahamii]|uniref:Crp/Fnr family transcriptional regulator n=1 Tax=Rhizobium grahamii TaxID=1120045 RepID=A0A370KFE5_9HYPH|nr:Crp/Fnr family transcriptional regulator [Rhizobium grahamii]
MEKTLRGKCILVVEDDYYVATDLAAKLSAHGVDVAGPTAGVRGALTQIRSNPCIEGAILDLNLGGEMAFPVADELERRGVPFIFATGYEPDVVPARHADKILLRKPLDDDTIAVALLDAFHRRGATPEDVGRNGILRRLPASERDDLLPLLRTVYLPRGAIMEMQGQSVSRVYFPLDCVASLVAVSREGNRIETGLIGNEGMTGFGIAEGDEETPFELINQIEGYTLAIAADDFKQALAIGAGLRTLAIRFARSVSIQVSYTALANGRLDIPRRLARWLLMVHDRVDQNPFHLTHDYLAIMLGVRRSSVTDALHLLEGERLIKSTRNSVEIVTRHGLIDAAGEVYGAPEIEYERLMNLPLDPSSETVCGAGGSRQHFVS